MPSVMTPRGMVHFPYTPQGIVAAQRLASQMAMQRAYPLGGMRPMAAPMARPAMPAMSPQAMARPARPQMPVQARNTAPRPTTPAKRTTRSLPSQASSTAKARAMGKQGMKKRSSKAQMRRKK